MSKLIVLVAAVVGTLFCLNAYDHGNLWHTGFKIGEYTIMYAYIVLAAMVYMASHLHAKK